MVNQRTCQRICQCFMIGNLLLPNYERIIFIYEQSNFQFSKLSDLCNNISMSMKLGDMDQATSSEIGYSCNVASLPTSSKEWAIACILATKFHTEPVIDSGLDVRLNLIMKDLVINRQAVKNKLTKRQKK
jgi:hypothetical protein